MIRKITTAAVLTAPLVYLVLADHGPSRPIPSRPAMLPAVQPAILAAVPSFRSASIEEDDTEVVLGIPVRKDRDCRVELKDYVTTEGEMFSAYSCTPNSPPPAHAYADYDNATLANMAYSDADAAALLGRRYIGKDTGKSYELLIRASALEGGNVEPLAWLAEQAFGVIEIDGEPQLENMQHQYELAALASRLGGNPGKAMFLKQELARNGVEGVELDTLDSRVDALLRSMRNIQRSVHGEVTIGGHDDA